MKNAKDMMRNIMQVYYKHNDQFLDRPYYRYVGMEEYKSLLSSKKMYFTNPIDWKLSDTGDDTENYFEDWMLSEHSIREAYTLISDYHRRRFGKYYMHTDVILLFCNFLAAASMLQQSTYCYCVANTYNDNKMVAEYHKKYGRNIIIKYKNDFYKNISVLNDGRCILRNYDYLYADVMPMVYINDFSEFITKIITDSDNIQELAKNVFDYGAFLKHDSFSYEHEIRIKLRMYLADNTSIRSLASDYYDSMWDIHDENVIVKKSMDLLNKERIHMNMPYKQIDDRFVKIGNKRCFELSLGNEFDIKNIVDVIMLHKCATYEEKETVYKLARQNGVSVYEKNFDLM